LSVGIDNFETMIKKE